mgnify:CR=1 FL=1
MRVRVLTNNSARFIGGCQTSTGTCTTRGYKFGPEVWMVFRTPDQRTCGQSRARQAIIPSGQLNNRLSEYVHIMAGPVCSYFPGYMTLRTYRLMPTSEVMFKFVY